MRFGAMGVKTHLRKVRSNGIRTTEIRWVATLPTMTWRVYSPAMGTGKRRPRLVQRAATNTTPAPAATARVAYGNAELFAPLTCGERADALRTLTEDRRLATMAKVGRYRVITAEPMVVKPPEDRAGSRLARVVIYDYASNRCVDASVDLDRGDVAHLAFSNAQPMLAREEEAAAVAVAMHDARVNELLSLGDEPQVAMHYWSNRETDLAYSRRSAAVLFGPPGARPSLVAVVDLVDNQVAEIVPADQW